MRRIRYSIIMEEMPDEIINFLLANKEEVLVKVRKGFGDLPEGVSIEMDVIDDAVPANDNIPAVVPVKPSGASVPSVKKAA